MRVHGPPYLAGPPLHVHPSFDQSFLVVDGELEVRVTEEVVELVPGASAFVSGRAPHTSGDG